MWQFIYSTHSDVSKKSVKAQVEAMASERGLEVKFVFKEPPGFVYQIGYGK